MLQATRLRRANTADVRASLMDTSKRNVIRGMHAAILGYQPLQPLAGAKQSRDRPRLRKQLIALMVVGVDTYRDLT